MLIERRKARIAEDFYDIGQALTELLKKKLYLVLGYSSFAQMLTKRGVMSARTVIDPLDSVSAHNGLTGVRRVLARRMP